MGKSIVKTIVKTIALVAVLAVVVVGVRAIDPIDDLQQQINQLSRAREQSIAATKPLEGELARLTEQLNSIRAGIEQAKGQLRGLEASIAAREADFAVQYALLSERVVSFYKASRAPSGLVLLLTGGTSSNLISDLFYRQTVTDQDKQIIAQITADLLQLEKDKQKVEADRVRLADLQAKLDKEAEFFEGEIAGAKSYQAILSQQIASLTAQQQQIIAAKLGSLNLPQSLGAGPLYCTDDRKLDPGFGSAFAFYTYGIPHRVGMNQYGAYGRSKVGQDYRAILNAYFNSISFEAGKENIQIQVQGQGSMPLDEYLLGIYEMPESWPLEALKAQAVAARSYALAYTDNGAKEICTTQACQVWKPEKKTGAWKTAVEATRGEIMVSGGQTVTGWYSSTDGGYTFYNSDVWGGSQRPWTKRMRDTSGDVGGFGDLNERAYDKESPCFYAAQGWRNEYGKSAWLKGEEVADIANVILLARADSSVRAHLYQVDKPNPEGTDTWDAARVRQELSSRGVTPLSGGAGSVAIGADFGEGRTTQVTVDGVAFTGSEFKDWFNLRAPANIQIVGPLYNVERR